jgi:hypothetical protein
MPDPDQMSREQLIEARADVKRQIDELRYQPLIGRGIDGASPKAALFERLNAIVAEIDAELAEMEIPMPNGPQGQKRKADVIGNAVLIGRIAADEVEETVTVPVLYVTTTGRVSGKYSSNSNT